MKTFYSLLFLILIQLFAQAQDAQLSVLGNFSDTLMLTTYQRAPQGQRSFLKFANDGDSVAKHVFDIPESDCDKRFYLSCNKNLTLFELKAGQHVVVDISGDKMAFSGDNALVNNYLNSWVQQNIMSFDNGTRYRLMIKNVFNKPARKFPLIDQSQSALVKLKTMSAESLETLEKSGINDSLFLSAQRVWIKYLPWQILLDNYITLKYQEKILAGDFVNMLKEDCAFENDILVHPDLMDLMSRYFQAQEDLLGYKRIIPHQLEGRAAILKSPELQEYYVLSELKQLVRSKNPFMLDQILTNVEPFVRTESGKRELKELQPQVELLLKNNMTGQDAFPFAYEDETGKIVRLDDFKGKYILIDVWATWCGPCVMNIPYVMELEEKLKDKNIAFVSLSIDKSTNKQAWLDFVREKPSAGIQLIAHHAFNDELCKYYNIHAIPRFILIDPQGKIVSAHCRQAMDKGFQEYLIDLISNS